MKYELSALGALTRPAIALAVTLPLMAGCSHHASPNEQGAQWVELFNGETLEGWRPINGAAPFTVEDGVIRGTNVFDSPNSFLATDESYSDFVLEFESKSIGGANSGVQFRTDLAPGTWSGVIGYQLDIDPTERRWTGGIYHEGAHVWRHSMARNSACQAAYAHGEWNAYRIEAVGPVIATWVNGVPCAHMIGDHHATGFVALQIHDIGQDENLLGSFTEWRQIRLLKDPSPSDLRSAERGELVEGWLDNQISDVEAEKGWQPFAFAEGHAALDVETSRFEISLDLEIDDAAAGHLSYQFLDNGETCAGRYKILNDVTLAESQLPSDAMGSADRDRIAENLSEPGRPKRIYNDARLNRVQIIVSEDRIEHWLNSVKVVDYAKCDFIEVASEQSIEPAQVALHLVTTDGQIDPTNMKFKASPDGRQ